jgi:cytoskeletal protein RodZ
MGTDTKAAQAVMSRIGQKLRAAREKKPLTIDQVQKQTRIHSAVIKALEDGRLDEMLTPTYVRSFLRKYAEHLGLDGRQFLSEYANLRRADQSSLGVVMSRMKPSSRLRFRALFAGAIRAAVIVIAI